MIPHDNSWLADLIFKEQAAAQPSRVSPATTSGALALDAPNPPKGPGIFDSVTRALGIGVKQAADDAWWSVTHPVDRVMQRGRASNPQMSMPGSVKSVLRGAAVREAGHAVGTSGYWGSLTRATNGEYRVSPLANGLMRVEHRPSGLIGLFEQSGAKRSGMISIPSSVKSVPQESPVNQGGAWGLHLFGDGPDAGWQGTYTSRAAAEAAKKQIPGERTGSRILKRKYK